MDVNLEKTVVAPSVRPRGGVSEQELTKAFPAVALMCVAVIWGLSYVVVKDILAEVSPSQYLMLRFLIALPIVAIIFRKPIALWVKKLMTAEKGNRRDFGRVFFPGFSLVFAFVLQAYGLKQCEPGTAAFLTSLVFLFVPIVEWLNGERIKWRSLGIPCVMALIGSTLMTGFYKTFNVAAPGIDSFNSGHLLLLLSAIAYSFHIYLSGQCASKDHSSVNFIAQGTVVLVSSTLWCLAGNFSLAIHISRIVWLKIIFVSLVVTAASYVIQFWAQKFVAPRYVGLIYTMEPVAAMGLALAAGYQKPSVLLSVGALCILCASTLSALRSFK